MTVDLGRLHSLAKSGEAVSPHDVIALCEEIARLRALPPKTIFQHVPASHIEAQHFEKGYRAGVDSIHDAIGPIVQRIAALEAGLRQRIATAQGALTKTIRTTRPTEKPLGRRARSARKRGRR